MRIHRVLRIVKALPVSRRTAMGAKSEALAKQFEAKASGVKAGLDLHVD
jgi:hypothetical protein